MAEAARWTRFQFLKAAITVAVACFLFVVLSLNFSSNKSVTFDETIYTVLAQGSLHQRAWDPRVSRLGIAPLPLLLTHVPASAGHSKLREDHFRGRPDDLLQVMHARLWAIFLFGCPIVAIVTVWLIRRRGFLAGLAGGLLVAGSPSVIAHGSLATTDACFTLSVLVVAAGCTSFLQLPSKGRFTLLCALCGLAFSAKYSAIALAPLLGLAVMQWTRRSTGWRHACRNVVIALLIAAVIICGVAWVIHGFQSVPFDPSPESTSAWRVPAPIAGLRAQILHQRRGHFAFLLKQRSIMGWWYYFPVTVFAKNTPPELCAFFMAFMAAVLFVVRWCNRWRRQTTGEKDIKQETADASVYPSSLAPLCWSILILSFWLAAIVSSVNIGHRHLLPLMPLSILLWVDIVSSFGIRKKRTILLILVTAQLINSALARPHYLAYFSPLIGGPLHGHVWLSDSNLDWGQDLPALRKWMDQYPDRHCRLIYFGTADIGSAGLSVTRWQNNDLRQLEEVDFLAISVTVLQQTYPLMGSPWGSEKPNANLMKNLFKETPTARAGHSIWIFDVRKSPALRSMAAEAIPLNNSECHP